MNHCVPSPCDGICSKNGVCTEEYDENNKLIAICTCKPGFQDNNNDLTCSPKCEENDCLNGYCDTTNYKQATCICDEGYQDSNNNLICEISCNHKGYNCEKNGICEVNPNGIISCECNKDYLYTANELGCYNNGYVNTFTIPSLDDDNIYDVIKDLDGNLYFIGEFRGKINLGVDLDSDGGKASFIVKMNNNVIIWTKVLKGSGSIEAKNIIYNDNKLYISGSYSGEIDFNPSDSEEDLKRSGDGTNSFLNIIDTNGNYVDSFIFNGVSFIENEKLIIKNNEIYILGQFKTEVEFKTSDGSFEKFSTTDDKNDLFLAKINQNLEYEWVKQFGNNLENDFAGSFDVDSNHNIYLAYKFNAVEDLGESKLLKINSIGEVIEESLLPKIDYIKSLILQNDFLYILGYNTKKITLMKYNLANNDIKYKTINSNYALYGVSLKMDSDKNLYILGKGSNEVIFSETPYDVYINPNNKFLFITKIYYDFTYGYSIVFGSTEDIIDSYNFYVSKEEIYVAGSFRGKTLFSSEFSENDDLKTSVAGDDLFLWYYEQ